MHLCINSCICTTASSHTLSLRQQFGADLLISIATIARVGGSDIKKIDCHKKKARVQQKEGDCNRGVTQGGAPPVSEAAGGLCFIKNKHERTAPTGYQTLSDKDGEINWLQKEGGEWQRAAAESSPGFQTLDVLPLFSSYPPVSFLHFFILFSRQKPPLYAPLISPLPPFDNTLTPPN